MASVYSTIQFLKSHGSVTHVSETAEGVLVTSWATHNAPCGDDDHWFEEMACFPSLTATCLAVTCGLGSGTKAETGASPSARGARTDEAMKGRTMETYLSLNEAAKRLPLGFDGEIITYRRGKMDRFENVSSKVMSAAGEPEFVFHVFDDFSQPYSPFERRMEDLLDHPCFRHYSGFLRPVECGEAYSMPELMRLHRSYIKQGFEGTIIRAPDAEYKHGRSTAREGALLKLKDFDDSEARIVGFVERLNHEPSLGAFVMSWRGVEFNIGTGFTETQRNEYWSRRHSLIGRSVTFSYQGVGTNGRPRFPSFVGFRRDLVAA